MIEKGSAPSPARPAPAHRPAGVRQADPAAARRFDDLVRSEPKPKGASSKAGSLHHETAETETGETAGNALAQGPMPATPPRPSASGGVREQGGEAQGGLAADTPPRAPVPDLSARATVQHGGALPEQAFAAMLDRVHLQPAGQSQTLLTMSDTGWLAREATITQSDGGALSLSLSMNMGSGSGEALEELRRRLEARGLAVDRIAGIDPS